MGLLLFAGCSTPTGPPPGPAAQPYRTGPPDQLDITILPDPIIERSVVVRPDGMISIDLIGDIPASGRTTEEIASDIEKRISRFKRDANVTVALAESRSIQITILGEVGRPSTFALTRDTRAVEALGQVGGPTLLAAKSRIKVIRFQESETRVYRVNLSAMEDGRPPDQYLAPRRRRGRGASDRVRPDRALPSRHLLSDPAGLRARRPSGDHRLYWRGLLSAPLKLSSAPNSPGERNARRVIPVTSADTTPADLSRWTRARGRQSRSWRCVGHETKHPSIRLCRASADGAGPDGM